MSNFGVHRRETTWAVSWCGQVRRHVGSPFTGTVQLSGLGLRPIPCTGNIIWCPFHIELGKALSVLTFSPVNLRHLRLNLLPWSRFLRDTSDRVFECPDECHGRWKAFRMNQTSTQSCLDADCTQIRTLGQFYNAVVFMAAQPSKNWYTRRLSP